MILPKLPYCRGCVLTLLAAVVFFLPVGIGFAQDMTDDDEGRVRIQGRVIDNEEDIWSIDERPQVDYAEEMREFIERITQFSRSYVPNFGVIVENALSLLIKTSPADVDFILPARAYIRSIDGIMPTGVFYGSLEYGERFKDENFLQQRLDLIERAKTNGLPVFVLDKTDDPAKIDDGQSRAASLDYAYGSATHSDFAASVLPDYPARPYNENAQSVLSLNAVRNFAVLGNSILYGREDEFALLMNNNNYDLLVVDVFHGRQPLSKRAVETLKYKQNGARRLVYARVNIGTASAFLYYWRNNWGEGSPPWMGQPLPDRPDTYYVEYWRPEWQRLITGDTESYIYGVVDQGYDGVVLADVDIYRYFDGSIREEEEEFYDLLDYLPHGG